MEVIVDSSLLAARAEKQGNIVNSCLDPAFFHLLTGLTEKMKKLSLQQPALILIHTDTDKLKLEFHHPVKGLQSASMHPAT